MEENKTFVSALDMRKALDAFGIEKDSILITHSSLKACGQIENGPYGVIEALEATVPDGTLVFPTLSQKNFRNAFEDWHLDRPSDVGLISETFRKQEGSLRSDNPTHSVAARGRDAADLVGGPANEGARHGIYGDFGFGHYSPWQKMYESRTLYGVKTYVLFWGCTMTHLTFKHLIEYMFVEEMFAKIKNPALLAEVSKTLATFPTSGAELFTDKTKHWPFYASEEFANEVLIPEGIAKVVPLGDNFLYCADVFALVERTREILFSDPYRFIYTCMHPWIEKLLAAIEAGN